ncbi:acyl-CoA dehydrogenase family protein [Spirillospora sp. NPDC000708]
MGWIFETNPEHQKKLDWADAFVREEVEPLAHLWGNDTFLPRDESRRKILDPRKAEVKRHGLWATHLGPELGGQGYGQLELALLNEILGWTPWASQVFGCQAPDTGNAEIIAHYGTEEQKERYLQPLLDGEIFSGYSMSEPHAGADPTRFTCRAVKDRDEWVINGWKYFSSNAKVAAFLIVMAVTDPDVSRYQGMSMFLVPTDTAGVKTERNVGLYGEAMNDGSHALIHYDDVRVPADALLGGENRAFAVAQTRLGGDRIHHAMRTIGLAQKALDMMCTAGPVPALRALHRMADAVLPDDPRRRRDGPRRQPDRSAQRHRGQAGTARPPAQRRSMAHGMDPPGGRGRPGQVRRPH